jgi:hypothetical protein
MLIRILALVFLFSACSDAATTTEDQKEVNFILATQADVSQRVATILADTPYPLTAEQKAAIDELTAPYTIESLNDGKQTRSELRKKIQAMLPPEQVNAWKEKNRKKRRSITIE